MVSARTLTQGRHGFQKWDFELWVLELPAWDSGLTEFNQGLRGVPVGASDMAAHGQDRV